MSDRQRVTGLVATCEARGGRGGDADTEQLFRVVYDELRQLARRLMAGERRSHTLQPTALVHEAYVRLVDGTAVGWRGRTHFYAVGARVMRNILVDHARALGRDKRGGDWQRVTLGAAGPPGAEGVDREELLALDEVLDRLAAVDERAARVVELRFFGGLTVDEAAAAIGVSRRTVESDWTYARAWLLRELGRKGAE